MKILKALISIVVVAGIGLAIGFFVFPSKQISFSAVNQKISFSATGTTNTTSTVNTTSTQVLSASWTNYAALYNTGTSTISCYLESTTAASSSVAVNGGVIINGNTSPHSYVSFGYNGEVPYIGAVNCLANVKTIVGVIKN